MQCQSDLSYFAHLSKAYTRSPTSPLSASFYLLLPFTPPPFLTKQLKVNTPQFRLFMTQLWSFSGLALNSRLVFTHDHGLGFPPLPGLSCTPYTRQSLTGILARQSQVSDPPRMRTCSLCVHFASVRQKN